MNEGDFRKRIKAKNIIWFKWFAEWRIYAFFYREIQHFMLSACCYYLCAHWSPHQHNIFLNNLFFSFRITRLNLSLRSLGQTCGLSSKLPHHKNRALRIRMPHPQLDCNYLQLYLEAPKVAPQTISRWIVSAHYYSTQSKKLLLWDVICSDFFFVNGMRRLCRCLCVGESHNK